MALNVRFFGREIHPANNLATVHMAEYSLLVQLV